MKQIFDLFTRAEIEIIVNTGKLSEEQKALFKREGIAQKEAINYAKEVLKYLPSDEAEEFEEEEIDQENYFVPEEEEQAEPTANFEEVAQAEEETQPAELLQEIEKVVAEQPQQTAQEPQKRTGRTALERLSMLKKLDELNDKHLKTTQMLTRITAMQKEHEENEGVTLNIHHSKFPSINISKNLAVNLCLDFVQSETQKQLKAIENEIENLDF
jgi:hypothetical protein